MFASISRRSAATAVVLALAVAFGASAQTPGSPAATGSAGAKGAPAASAKTAPNPDRSFVETAAMGGMAEVELGNLAQQKASDDQVREFGARMVKDHGAANEELKQLAGSKGIQLPSSLGKKHRGDIDRLGKMSGAEFDRAYMSHMVSDHKKDIDDFKKQASSGKDPELKSFAAKTLPTLQEHLQLAQKTSDGLKKTKTGSTKAGSK